MFCPKCGSELVRRDGHLYCEAGDMYLSPNMEAMLTEAIEGQPVRTVPLPPDPQTVFGWRCPRCRGEMANPSEGGTRLEAQCPRCGLMLTKSTLYRLVEIHPRR